MLVLDIFVFTTNIRINQKMKMRNSFLFLLSLVIISTIYGCGAPPPIPFPASGTLGGNVSGLAQGSSVTLTTLLQTVTVNANGSFTFPGQTFGPYNVTVLSQPTNQTCVVSNGTGIIIIGNSMTNVQVSCSYSYTIGGTVYGLSELNTLILTTNGQLVTALGNGSNSQTFTFLIPLANGSAYNVSILSQPFGQTCTLTNNSGTVDSANVTNVTVNCPA